jgi:hypothetical protein
MSRTGRFQQAALVLQWDSLPFYYMHRLLTFAQSSNTVSRVNEVTQRDFEYITPQINVVDGEPVDEAFTEGITIRNLSNDDVSLGNNFPIVNGTLPRLQRVDTVLKRFWDSLPDDAKARWFDEKPDALDSSEEQRKFSSLPDPDVVYQFIQTYIGNLEVQAEVFCGALTEIQGAEEVVINRYQIRQLGREMIVVQRLNILEPEQTHGDFRVHLLLMRLTPIQLLTVNQINNVPMAKIDTQFFLIGAGTASHYHS